MNIQGSFQKAGNWLGKKGATLAVAGAVGASLAPGVTKAADDQVLLNPGGVDQICMSFAPLEMVYQTRNGGDLGKAQFLITLDNNHPTATLERPAEIDVRILAPGLHYHLHVTSN